MAKFGNEETKKVRVTISTEEGEVLDKFFVLAKGRDARCSVVQLANEVTETICLRHETDHA